MWPFKREAPSGEIKSLQVLAVLDPAEVESLGGLPREAVAGTVEAAGGAIDASRFRPNPAFTAFIHHVIGTFGPQDLELREAARQQGEGLLYIIDLRTPGGPAGEVPPEAQRAA